MAAVGGGGGGGGGGTVSVEADPDGAIAYVQKSLSASAGENTFDFNNPASIGHDFCIESSDGNEVGCSDIVTGDKTTLVSNLKPGDYTFFCSVDSHREQGMEGTLTVK